MNTNSCAAANRGNSHFRRADRAARAWLFSRRQSPWLLPRRLRRAAAAGNIIIRSSLLAVTRALDTVTKVTGSDEAPDSNTSGGRVPGGRWRRSAIARLDRGRRGSEIRPWMEVHLDDADARQRSRFHVFDAAAESEKSLEASRNVGLDFKRRHTRIKRRHHDCGNLQIGKHIYRHPGECGDSQYRDYQRSDDDGDGVRSEKLGTV